MGLVLLLLLTVVAADTPAKPATPAKEAKPTDTAKAKADDAKKADESKAKDKTKPEPPKTRRVQNRSYVPSPGDRAVLYCGDEKGESLLFWVATTPHAFREYSKAEAMDDKGRTDELEKDKSVLVIEEDETAIVVLSVEPVPIVTSVEERGARGFTAMAVVVRALDGPHKGKQLIAPSDVVTRMVVVTEKKKGQRSSAKKGNKPRATKAPNGDAAKPDARAAKTTDPAARAASLLRLGQGLEKSGKTAGALEFYRQVVKQYPNTPQAKTAASRIAALDKKSK